MARNIHEQTLGNAKIDFARASIEHLSMTGCALAFDCVDRVVQSIASLPNLKHLTCSVWKHIPSLLLRLNFGQQLAPLGYHAEYTYETLDLTEGLLMMLERGKIESISSMSAHVHIPSICKALAANKSLKIMDLTSSAGLARRANQAGLTVEDELCLLQVLVGPQDKVELAINDASCVGGGGSTTLEDVPRISSPRLRYYMALNRCGRAQARDERHTTLECFVALLAQVNSSTARDSHSRLFSVENHLTATQVAGKKTSCSSTSGSNDDEWKELTKHQVLYGLLMENPVMWCTPRKNAVS